MKLHLDVILIFDSMSLYSITCSSSMSYALVLSLSVVFMTWRSSAVSINVHIHMNFPFCVSLHNDLYIPRFTLKLKFYFSVNFIF